MSAFAAEYFAIAKGCGPPKLSESLRIAAAFQDAAEDLADLIWGLRALCGDLECHPSRRASVLDLAFLSLASAAGIDREMLDERWRREKHEEEARRLARTNREMN